MTFGAEVVYGGGYFDDPGETLWIGDVKRANPQAVHTVAPALQLYVRGENLLDDRTPPISATASRGGRSMAASSCRSGDA